MQASKQAPRCLQAQTFANSARKSAARLFAAALIYRTAFFSLLPPNRATFCGRMDFLIEFSRIYGVRGKLGGACDYVFSCMRMVEMIFAWHGVMIFLYKLMIEVNL